VELSGVFPMKAHPSEAKGGLPVQKVLKLPAGFLPRQNFRKMNALNNFIDCMYTLGE
jgi:hypothetical protein